MASSQSATAKKLYFAFGSNLLKERITINNPSAEFVDIAKLEVSDIQFMNCIKLYGEFIYVVFIIFNLRKNCTQRVSIFSKISSLYVRSPGGHILLQSRKFFFF